MTTPTSLIDDVHSRLTKAVESADHRQDTEQRELLADLLAEALAAKQDS